MSTSAQCVIGLAKRKNHKMNTFLPATNKRKVYIVVKIACEIFCQFIERKLDRRLYIPRTLLQSMEETIEDDVFGDVPKRVLTDSMIEALGGDC